jgi:acetate kinase
MADSILVVNAGSSSLKFQIFQIGAERALTRRLKGSIDGIGTRPRLVAKDAGGTQLFDEEHPASEVMDLPAALALAQVRLRAKFGGEEPVAVGHRVVHGGTEFSAPTLIDDGVIAYLERLSPLAPLHQPNNLAPIKALRARSPELPQVACFDTAFHRTHSQLADRFALPEVLYAEGVRRYGFHGLSYEYIARRLPTAAPEIADSRVIVAHLGSGASMCALVERRSVESTMGFTALDGVPMGTRPGQLDPGVVLYLMSEKRMGAKAIERFLYTECGLKGLSGISNDVRDLLASPDPRAAFALEFFAYRIAMLAGSLAAAMGGIDGFVFTAGIGENAPAIREKIARRLAWLGLDFDEAANRAGAPRISRPGSAAACYVVPTDEELMIARHTLDVLDGSARRR